MLNKITSSVILAACFPIMAITPSHPASLLFIFVSGNKFVAVARLALALILFAVSWGLISRRFLPPKALLYSAFLVIGLGLFGLVATSIGYILYDYFKVMDIMILVEAGIVFCSLYIQLESRPSEAVAAKKAAKPSMKLSRA